MSFSPIELQHNDYTLSVPSNRVLGLVATIEEHITLNELSQFAHSQKRAKLAYAWAAALAYANGCTGKTQHLELPNQTALADELYLSTFAPGQAGADNMVNAALALLTALLPPKEITDKLEQLGDSGAKKRKTKIA